MYCIYNNKDVNLISVSEIAVNDMCHMSEGPCQNGALCQRTNNGFVCQCPSGLCGVNCNYGKPNIA